MTWPPALSSFFLFYFILSFYFSYETFSCWIFYVQLEDAFDMWIKQNGKYIALSFQTFPYSTMCL